MKGQPQVDLLAGRPVDYERSNALRITTSPASWQQGEVLALTAGLTGEQIRLPLGATFLQHRVFSCIYTAATSFLMRGSIRFWNGSREMLRVPCEAGAGAITAASAVSFAPSATVAGPNCLYLLWDTANFDTLLLGNEVHVAADAVSLSLETNANASTANLFLGLLSWQP